MHHLSPAGSAAFDTPDSEALSPNTAGASRISNLHGASRATTGLAFHRGLVVRTGWLRWLSAPQLLPTAWRLRLPLLALGLAMAGVLLLSGLPMGTLALCGTVLGLGLLLVGAFQEWQVTTPLRAVAEAAHRVAAGGATQDLGLNRCDDIGMLARSVHQAGLNQHVRPGEASGLLAACAGPSDGGKVGAPSPGPQAARSRSRFVFYCSAVRGRR
jgi:aerotaxis receptor